MSLEEVRRRKERAEGIRVIHFKAESFREFNGWSGMCRKEIKFEWRV